MDEEKVSQLEKQLFTRTLLTRLAAPPKVQPTKKGIYLYFLATLSVALAVFSIMRMLVPARTIAPIQNTPAIKEPAPELLPIQPPPFPKVDGVYTFRGDFARTGRLPGPVPRRPALKWRYPQQPMCAESVVGNTKKTWCGTGWTGQPVVWRRPDGVSEVIFGAFDKRVHFIKLQNGFPSRQPLVVGDIIKGSATIDPEGEPLLYIGGRDNRLRIVALDRNRPLVLWTMNANNYPGRWNDDWDGTPLVQGDFMFVGGEDGIFYAVKLNRDYNVHGLVSVQPEITVRWPAWNSRLLELVGDGNNSIESSVASYGYRLYFTNSAGRLVGLNQTKLTMGLVEVVFDFWLGDDADATVAIDEYGMIYAAVELERYLPRSEQVGQLLKLNPYSKEEPVVWSIPVPPGPHDGMGGAWASPAISESTVYFTTNSGLLLAVEREFGRLLQTEYIGPHAWSSPVLCGSTLVVATCNGEIISFAISGDGRLQENWRFQIPGQPCIESTPLVWDGHIVVGARDGFIYSLADLPP